jgi:hypothetical protein
MTKPLAARCADEASDRYQRPVEARSLGPGAALQRVAVVRRVTTPRPRSADHGACLAAPTNRKPWRARIWLKNRGDIQLGYFATQAEARAAHAEAAKRFGLELKGR